MYALIQNRRYYEKKSNVQGVRVTKTDPQTQELEERGEFVDSYSKVFEGVNVVDINNQVVQYLEIAREESGLDVRVWHGQ